MFTKKSIAALLTFAFLFLIITPDLFANHRDRRYRNRFVSGRTYYRPAYYGTSYYGAYPYQSTYYRSSSFRNRRFFDRDGRRFGRDRGGLGSTGRALLTIGAPAAIGAGVGALLSGKKGAAVGALLGGGGGAAYYLIKRRDRDRYRRRF
ncbi:MAG TPA: hypothetical protein VE262_16950 [Blastocatellia bacterium]|nr:hypothetical protein [Blastocatellia bacterium]